MKHSGENSIHVRDLPQSLQESLKYLCPGIDLIGTVVAMNHGYWLSRWGGDHINLRIDLGQGLLQHDHSKHTGTCGHIAGAGNDSVGSNHASTRVSFRGSQRNARGQKAGRVQKFSSLWGEGSGGLAGVENLRQNLPYFPWIVLLSHQGVEGVCHCLIIVPGAAIDREHAAGLPDSDCLTAGEPVVDVSRQGGKTADILDMFLIIEDGLIEVGDRPSLRNVELETLR